MKMNRSSLGHTIGILLIGVSLTIGIAQAFAVSPASPPADNGNFDLKSQADFNRSILETMDAERESIAKRQSQLSTLQAGQEAFKSEISALSLQLSTHGNLLLSSALDPEAFKKAIAANRLSLDQVQRREKEVAQELEKIFQTNLKNEEQYQLNGAQMAQLTTDMPSTQEHRQLVQNLAALLKLLEQKRALYAQLMEIYTVRKNTFEELQKKLKAQGESLEERLSTLKKQLLFQRWDTPLRIAQWRHLAAETEQVRAFLRQILTVGFWRTELTHIWELQGLLLISFTLLLMITLGGFARIRRYMRELAARPFYTQHPWRLLAFQVLTKQLPLMGILLFMGLITYFRKVNNLSVLILVQSILWIGLFSRWWLDALRRFGRMTPPPLLPLYIGRLKSLVRMCRWFAVLYLLADWMITGTSVTLFFLRGAFEGYLIIWGLSLRKQAERQDTGPASGKSSGKGIGRSQRLITVAYGIIWAGPLLELAGFGEFALYWYRSWGLTLTILLWAVLTLQMLREWDRPFTVSSPPDHAEQASYAQPIHWAALKISWLLWAFVLILALGFAWGGRQPVLAALFQTLRYSFQVGQMQLNMLGFIYAFLLLFFTHLLAKTLRFFLKEKLLAKSGIERGLQESITNIAAYLTWSFGILVALHAMGFNTASIAVVLGAMGIGLGFGLQNIFNNFISGIILLFERPIQVGDDVEVGGTWATVQKINVRSTIVQTYDNASLIIPNSEFISNQVTNWSFKDRRLRRKIVVGVAYGSDTALVKETLIEIAQSKPSVLRYPAPEVLFTDFGDSALIFTLRIWATVDNFLRLESDIRFEIDRLFNERNICIAFPQRDVHLYLMKGDEADAGALSPVLSDTGKAALGQQNGD